MEGRKSRLHQPVWHRLTGRGRGLALEVVMTLFSRRRVLALSAAALAAPIARAADKPSEIRIDWATYNPVSMLLKDKGWLEKEFAKDGISIKSVYVFSQPEWTALVVRKDSAVTKITDLKGKRVAVTRGTDPHIFLVRALLSVGMTEKDIVPVLLQHPDGKTALIRGDVDAWAGLDPMMAQAEVEDGARLFYRNKDANTWGILNTREEFLKDHPDLVRRVLAVYEEARKYSLANYDDVKKAFIAATKLPDAVVDNQLKERTELPPSRIGAPQRESILAAGLALQQAGVIPANVDVKKSVDDLIDDR